MVSVLSSLAGSGRVAGACDQKAFFCKLLLRHEGQHVWSGFPAQETTSKAAGPRQRAAQSENAADFVGKVKAFFWKIVATLCFFCHRKGVFGKILIFKQASR